LKLCPKSFGAGRAISAISLKKTIKELCKYIGICVFNRLNKASNYLSNVALSVPPVFKYQREASHYDSDKNDDEYTTLNAKGSKFSVKILTQNR
jgi:hypothetical protein